MAFDHSKPFAKTSATSLFFLRQRLTTTGGKTEAQKPTLFQKQHLTRFA
jgi:hypothetical protein